MGFGSGGSASCRGQQSFGGGSRRRFWWWRLYVAVASVETVSRRWWRWRQAPLANRSQESFQNIFGGAFMSRASDELLESPRWLIAVALLSLVVSLFVAAPQWLRSLCSQPSAAKPASAAYCASQ